MEVRYQVFVSSTYVDLKEERRLVSQAILKMGHFPAGMEMFPASDDEQFEYIRSVIDLCDYYILIIGGRYGSLSSTGISFTEMEYDYATSKGIPVCAFIHKNIGELKAKDVDSDPGKAEKLITFREKVASGKIVKFWDNEDNLEADALLALTNAINRKPQVGWRRADAGETREELQRRSRLTEQLEFYRKGYYKLETKLKSYEELKESRIVLRYTAESEPQELSISGERLIRQFASGLNNGLTRDEIESEAWHLIRSHVSDDAIEVNARSVDDINLFFEVFEIAIWEGEEEEDTWGDGAILKIQKEKQYLLKAAFRPLADVELENEIPF